VAETGFCRQKPNPGGVGGDFSQTPLSTQYNLNGVASRPTVSAFNHHIVLVGCQIVLSKIIG